MKKLCMVLLLCLPLQALAVKLAGVDVVEKATVGSKELVLNGAGLRTKVMFKVYIGALYLEKKANTTEAVLADAGYKRIQLVMMRHLNGGDFMEAFNKAIKENHTPEEYVPIAARLIRFSRVFREYGEIEKGDVINMDYIPGKGTIVSVKGKERDVIEGEDFYRSMLKIWMGKKPVQESLQKAMLGAS